MKKYLFILLFLLTSVAAGAITLKGTIKDSSSKESLIGAAIQVKGTSIGVITDLDGKFEIGNIKGGDYTLIISYMSYKTLEIDINISSSTKELEIFLEPDEQVLSGVTVTGRKNLEGILALQMERQMSTVAIENIGAKEMSIKGISNVQEGVKKITGISIASAGQLIVRGLGDRYSITTLNGLAIASPNPDNKLIPLDLFPSSTVQNITVSKVYDVSAFGDYSGAHIDISTKVNIPNDFFEISLNTGGAFNTLGQPHYQMSRDCSLFKTSKIDKKVLNMPLIEFDEYVIKNNIFNTTFAVNKKKSLPALGGNISVGKNFKLGDQTLSVLASINMSNDYQNVKNGFYKTLEAAGNILNDFAYDSYEQGLDIAALGYVGYTLRQADRIGYTFFYARNAVDTYKYRWGIDSEDHKLIGSNNVTHVYALQNHQLSGLHFFLNQTMELDWGLSYGNTSSKEPDRRQVMYNPQDDGTLKLFKLNRQETMRYFGDLVEQEWNADLSLKWSWKNNNFLKLGFNYKDKDRDYKGTRFYYNVNLLNDPIDNVYDTDGFLNQENIENGKIVVERKKQPKDCYYAGNEIFASYITTDFYPISQLLINLGVRYELNHQWVKYASDGGNWYAMNRTLNTHDFFPTLNLKYTINDAHNLRFSASRTVTRPSFIEMAPFLYQESYGASLIRGNEDLKNGYNYNLDLRYEFFRPNGDMVGLTTYFKFLDDPIERIQELSGGATVHSFRNADLGLAAGVEVEFRKEIVKNLSLGANASYMYTNVKLPEGGAYTNKERSLQGASPILVNADIVWSPKFKHDSYLDLALLYNLQGGRIHAVGISQLGDVKQDAVHTLNFNSSYHFNKHWALKLQVNDILGRALVFRQEVPKTGETIKVEAYRFGTNFQIGITYKL